MRGLPEDRSIAGLRTWALGRDTPSSLTLVGVFVAVALAWPVVDEVTQAIPVLGRTTSGLDILASELGVVTALAWIVALRPVGGTASRGRHAVLARAPESEQDSVAERVQGGDFAVVEQGGGAPRRRDG